MSANKLLQSLSEDPQLEKQIGCMAGILQLFDRHQVLTGRRLYGHKRISAAAPKTQTSPSSKCESPASETSGTSSENMLRHPSDNQKLKHAGSIGAANIAAAPEQQKSYNLSSPSTPTESKSGSVYSRTSTPLDDTPPNGCSRDQLPQISFDIARSSVLTPRRLDSSRSLHEGRMNVSHEGKVFARRSVDTAERAAAAARGALKELSRISTDFTSGPSHQVDQVSIREIVRSSFSKGQQASNSTLNASLSVSSGTMHTAFAPRLSSEGSTYAQRPGLANDMLRAQFIDARGSAESVSADKSMQSSNAYVPQAMGRMEASKPPRPGKPKSETPTQSRADINESLRLLAKLREATPAYNTLLGGNPVADNVGNKGRFSAQYASRPAAPINAEGPYAYASRAPLPRASDRVPDRMSCSYELSRSSSVDALLQGGSKVREIPRLSLDGRGSGAGFKADREAGSCGRPQYSRSLLNSRSVSCSNSDCDMDSLHEKRASFSSNVVAKLMGLEEMSNDELAEAAQMPSSYGPSDQKAQRALNMVVHDTNPTFSQCGKYVSASFFPSKRRDDIKIAMDLEEEEEDSYLQMDPLSPREARTLSVRVGSSNLQTRQQRSATESAHMGHPCYQPKNHHLIEDRPPHVLSPAARLCAQIEEMQRADSLHRGVDRGFRTMEMQQSTTHEQDLEALKQLLGTIHLNKGYSNSVESHLEDLVERGAPGKQHLENGRLSYLGEEQLPSSAVIWKTKRMLNDDLYAHTHYQIPNGRKISLESHNRKVRHSIQGPESFPSSRQHHSAQTYNQATHTQAEMRSTSPAASHPSAYSTPRRTNVSNDYITPMGTTNMAYRSASRTSSPSSFMSPRFVPSPQTLFSQQLRPSYYNNSSWEGSSVSSTSSAPARDQRPPRSSNHRAADKRNKQIDSVDKRKISNSFLKDKEGCKGDLVSSKPTPNAEKRSNSGVGLRSSAHTARKSTPRQNPDHVRSSMRSPTKASARKAEGVKRKLNFVNRSPGRIRPVQMDNQDQETEFVDKAVVSSINNNILSKQHHAQVHQSSESVSKTGHGEEPINTQLSNTTRNILPTETEVEVKSPLLLLPGAHGETDHEGQQVTASICDRDPEEHISEDVGSPATPMHASASALKLPQVPQQENEDTESQGDKSSGSCEQPSPISVLEGPFYEEDVSSPPTSTKLCLKLEGMEKEEGIGKDVKEECEGSLQLFECRSPCENHPTVDFDYVKQLLDMTGMPMDIDDESQSLGTVKLRPLEPHLFLQLEEENLNSAPDCKTELGSIWRRRMLFDGVNASLERRVRRWRLCQHQPWLLACETGLHTIMAEDCSPALLQGMIGLDDEKNVCLSREGRRVLLEEVWEEVGGMHGEQRRKRRKRMSKQQSVGMSACMEEEGEEEGEDGTCDDVGCMLEEDMYGGLFHTRRPDSWASLHVEKGELGLDLERLIFKDLIDHTIRDLGFSTLRTTKRQLFKPHT